MNKSPRVPTSPIDPAFRGEVDELLQGEETDQQFIERGLRSEAEASRTGKLHSATEVLAELDKILEEGRKRRGQ